ncbi:MAG: excisionase family DNA-binding protein [Alphaproteobacteria bacterium]|nr:excisionase family DNA-binding protein [Alphaproteobacteria bacterium]
MATLPNDEALIARAAAERLASAVQSGCDVRICLAEDREDIVLPLSAVRMFVEILLVTAEHGPISFASYPVELTAQQAADLLNVSRSYFDELLDKGEIDYRTVGSHRKVRVADLLAYKAKSDAVRRDAIAAMVAEAQELNLP